MRSVTTTCLCDNDEDLRDRAYAWTAWKGVRKILGPQALLDAIVLCLDGASGSYLGHRWATACQILYDYLTGQLTPLLFLDRIFTLAHNSNSIFDKIQWNGAIPSDCRDTVGPAHATDPPDWFTLLAYAGDDVVELFRTFWREANRAHIRQGRRPRYTLTNAWKEEAWTSCGTGTERSEPTNDPASTVSSTSMTTPGGTTIYSWTAATSS